MPTSSNQSKSLYDQLTVQEFFKDETFPLVAFREDRRVNLRLHTHEFAELVIIKSGRGTHVTLDESYPVGAGDVFFIPESMVHGYQDIESLELFNVLYISKKLPWNRKHLEKLPGYRLLFELEPQARKVHGFESHLHLHADILDEVSGVLMRLTRELKERKPGFETMSVGLFYELVALLTRAYDFKPNSKSLQLKAIDRAIDYIHSNYDEEIDVNHLAEVSCMSERTFYRVFRDITRISPKQYLLKLRIQHAKDDLLLPDARVTEVALNNGFSDGNYFTRLFRENEGMSPREWIKLHRKDNSTLLARNKAKRLSKV